MVGTIVLLNFTLKNWAARPKVTISASPASIVVGGSSTLTWTSTGATSASINNKIGAVPVNGSVVVKPAKTTKYTITVKNGSGSATANATVTVTMAPPAATFTSVPAAIAPGGSATLSWTTTGATSVSINQGIGIVALNGSRTVTPGQSIIYTLTAKGTGGTTTRQAAITVATPPTVSFSAAPMSIKPGETATLAWTSTEATSAAIDNAIGAVPVNGSIQITPAQNTMYTITASGPGGTASAQTAVYMSNGKACYAYVPDSSANNVAVIDTASNSVIKTIPTQGGPMGVALSQDGTRVFVSSIYGTYKKFFTLDTAANAVISEKSSQYVHIGAQFLAVDAARKYLYGASIQSYWDSVGYQNVSALYVFNMIQNEQIKCLLIPGNNQGGMVLHPDGTRLYLSKPDENAILCLDTTKLQRPRAPGVTYEYLNDEATATIEVNTPRSLAISVDGNRLYASGADGIAVLDTNSNNILDAITVSGGSLNVLAMHPDGNRLYAASSDMLQAIDTVTNAVTKTLAMENSDTGMNVHPDGNRLYITNRLNNDVSVVDAANLTLMATIPIAGSPYANGNFVGYVSESIAGKVTQDGVGLDGANVTVASAERNEAVVTDASGNYITAVKKGTYAVTPGKIGFAFSPSQRQVVVEQTLSGCDFIAALQAPTVTISAQPTTVRQGQPTTITWSSTHAASAVLDDGTGSSYCPVNGSDSKYISKTTTFTVTVTGPGGTATDNVLVTFDSSTAPTVSIAANPAAINPGESSTLTWQSYFATSAKIDNGIGNVVVNGSKVVTPVVTTTYKITVTGAGGLTGVATATIIVAGSVPSVVISASPAIIVERGSSTLTWTTTNADSASIDNGIGAVPVNGSVSVSPMATTTYILTAIGPGGSNSTSVKVTVEKAPPTVSFSATPEFIPPGGSATLTWTTKEATSVSIDQGVGAVDLNGSLTVSPTVETIYTFTAIGPGGTATASATIKLLATHLNSVWNGMKMAMLAGNINQAAAQFSDQTRDKYSQIFTAIADQLPQIALEMRDIEPVCFEEYGAKFRIKRTEEIEGVTYDITYYIYFVQEEDGSWKILNY